MAGLSPPGGGPLGAVVLIDGVVRAPNEASVSVFDRGFLFGDAVFEALRTYGGEPYALREHLDRLRGSALLLGIEPPPASLADEVEEGISRAQAMSSPAPDLYIRLILTRGIGPLHLDPTPATRPCRVVIVAPLLPLPPALRSGVSMATVLAHRAADGTSASAAKVNAYVGNLLAFAEAKRRGAYEALLVNEAGEILEGHSSSFFIVREGGIETPPLASGILPGITRAKVASLAVEHHIPFTERVLTPARVYSADEAFLSSSLREVVPVIIIDGVDIGGGKPGAITTRLAELYRGSV